jgi:chromosome segregation ATPase
MSDKTPSRNEILQEQWKREIAERVKTVSESKTPRTDAILQCGVPVDAELMTLARQLETELAEANAKLEAKGEAQLGRELLARLQGRAEAAEAKLSTIEEQLKIAEDERTEYLRQVKDYETQIEEGKIAPVDVVNKWAEGFGVLCIPKLSIQQFAAEAAKKGRG